MKWLLAIASAALVGGGLFYVYRQQSSASAPMTAAGKPAPVITSTQLAHAVSGQNVVAKLFPAPKPAPPAPPPAIHKPIPATSHINGSPIAAGVKVGWFYLEWPPLPGSPAASNPGTAEQSTVFTPTGTSYTYNPTPAKGYTLESWYESTEYTYFCTDEGFNVLGPTGLPIIYRLNWTIHNDPNTHVPLLDAHGAVQETDDTDEYYSQMAAAAAAYANIQTACTAVQNVCAIILKLL